MNDSSRVFVSLEVGDLYVPTSSRNDLCRNFAQAT